MYKLHSIYTCMHVEYVVIIDIMEEYMKISNNCEEYEITNL